MTLGKLNINEYGIIKKVDSNKDIKRRLFDIGLTPGTVVQCILENPGNNMKAYRVRGALIAIRNEDSNSIVVDVK